MAEKGVEEQVLAMERLLGFERIRITEFSASVGEYIFKQSQEIEGTKTLF